MDSSAESGAIGAARIAEGRTAWEDYNKRQEFEHLLIDRKTTWLLTTQSILLTAFALSFQTRSGVMFFRLVLSGCALLFALVTWFGIERVVESKRRNWKKYQAYFAAHEDMPLPKPLNDEPLQWGVETRNTCRSLLPDRVLPWIFVATWACLLVWSTTQ